LPSGTLPKKQGSFNPLNGKINPICHLLAVLGPHHILHFSRIKVNLVRNTGNKEPILRPRCIGPGGVRNQILFYSILHSIVSWNRQCTINILVNNVIYPLYFVSNLIHL
jgi:hypothetical protein